MNNKYFFLNYNFFLAHFPAASTSYLFLLPKDLLIYISQPRSIWLCVQRNLCRISSLFSLLDPWHFLSLQLLSQEVGPTLSSPVICLPLPWCPYCAHRDLASHLLINGEQNKRASLRGEDESAHRYLGGDPQEARPAKMDWCPTFNQLPELNAKALLIPPHRPEKWGQTQG